MPPSQSQPSSGPRSDLGSEAEGGQTALLPMTGLQVLFGAINTLKEDASCQELASVLKEVETLRVELESRETTIKQLELVQEKDRENFAFSTKSLVNEHHKRCTELESHRDGLATETSALQAIIQKRNDSRKELEDQQVQTQAEVAKLKKDLNSSNAVGRDERQKYLKLERDFQAAKGEFGQLKADFKRREGEINKLRESELSLQKRHNDMHQSLQSSDKELERLRDLAVELKTEPLATT